MFLMIIFISFPTVCFSKMETVTGESCKIYSGDLNNKGEYDSFLYFLRRESINNGGEKLKKYFVDDSDLEMSENIYQDLIDNYMKIEVISHNKVGRRICEKIKITLDPVVINEYLKELDREQKPERELKKINQNERQDNTDKMYHGILRQGEWCEDLDKIIPLPANLREHLTIGIIIENKTLNLKDRDSIENREESYFHRIIEHKNYFYNSEHNKKYRVVDRKHLSKVLEEQKISSSGLTDTETTKIGKLLNLDIIVLRIIYEDSRVTKVLKVDTGEVLLFKTYKEENISNQ